MSCPHCGRPVAMVRPACLYCGGALPAELVAAAQAVEAGAASTPLPERTAPPGEPRIMLVLHVKGTEDGLASALGLSPFEAGQRLRRGGHQLHRVLGAAEAEREAERLSEHGLTVFRLPEGDVQTAAAPLVALGGRFAEGVLAARTATGDVQIAARDVLLGLRGPIHREYQTRENWRKLRSATLADAYRFHLHRHGDPRPLELDPLAFEFDARDEAFQSSLLRLAAWVTAVCQGRVQDDSFRLLAPALGTVTEEETGAFKLVAAERQARGSQRSRESEPVILDNLRQFRFYSAWRGVLERTSGSSAL